MRWRSYLSLRTISERSLNFIFPSHFLIILYKPSSILSDILVLIYVVLLLQLFYNSGYNLPQKVYDSMLKEPVIVSLVQTLLPLKITRASDLTTTASYSVSANSFLDFVEENLCLLVYGPNKKPTEAESDS